MDLYIFGGGAKIVAGDPGAKKLCTADIFVQSWAPGAKFWRPGDPGPDPVLTPPKGAVSPQESSYLTPQIGPFWAPGENSWYYIDILVPM